jgi:hypothetical protein
VSAKLIFFIVAAAIAIGSAVLAGLTVAVIGLSVKMPAARADYIDLRRRHRDLRGCRCPCGHDGGPLLHRSAAVVHGSLADRGVNPDFAT